jgi:hypothetical protein
VKKDLARLIVDAVVSFDSQLGELDTLIGRIEDDDERKRYQKSLGDLMGSLFGDFLHPIERQYPYLDPDK